MRSLLFVKQSWLFFFVLFLPWQASAKPAYKKTLNRWTKGDEIFQREDFHASLKWHATFLSEEFLTAWATEHAKIYDLSDEERQDFLAEKQKQFAGRTGFFIAFYSYHFREADLTNPKSVWKLSLEEGGSVRRPMHIEKLSKPDSYFKRIFPYIDSWSQCYFVKFPQESTQDLNLKINGPTGKGHLTWKTR